MSREKVEIRKFTSRVLGYGIAEDKWDESFNILDKAGKITMKHLLQIILELLKREEEREKQEDSLI